MIYKRHKIFMYILIIYSLFFVSCNTLNTTSYKIDELLYEANIMAQNKDYEKAITTYNQILELDEFNQKALYNKSFILFKSKNTLEAISSVNLLIEHYPNNIKAYKLKADIYLYNNDIENVIKTYNYIFEIYPNLYDLRSEFIEILIDNYNNDSIIQSNLYDNAIILVNNNINNDIATKALYLLNKDNREYSLLLYLNNKKAWEEFNTPSLDSE